ncbi:chemotaxis signal transduction protein [Bacillus sp. V2I10]|nr:chemotaxis signal transduction protein [Bacillus sp. V2I10]
MTDAIKKQMKMIVFQLNHEEYGISVDKVRSIEKILAHYTCSRNRAFC